MDSDKFDWPDLYIRLIKQDLYDRKLSNSIGVGVRFRLQALNDHIEDILNEKMEQTI